MASIQKIWVGLIAVAIIAIGGYFFPQVKGAVAGAISSTDVAATNFTELTASIGFQTPVIQQGGNTAASSVISQVTTTSCNSATSTLFAIASPFITGTSTATIISISGTGQATTSSLLVGTSTATTGLASTNVSASVVNSTNVIATTSSFYIVPGLLVGPFPSGAGTVRTLTVDPTYSIVGYSTSTATGAGAAAYVPGFSCSIKIRWEQ